MIVFEFLLTHLRVYSSRIFVIRKKNLLNLILITSDMDDSHKLGFFGATSYVIGNIIGSGIFITPASILRKKNLLNLILITSDMDDSHKLGFFGATSYVIGNIIGSGIFITPASILRCTDSVGLSLIIWVLCALIAILGALVYIELGTSIREAGCDFAYICYVKWYSIAFAFMFVSVLMTYPATIAIIAETFGQYLVEGLKQVYDIDDDWTPLAQKLFGFSLLMSFEFIYFMGWCMFRSSRRIEGNCSIRYLNTWTGRLQKNDLDDKMKRMNANNGFHLFSVIVTWLNFFSLSKFAAPFQIIATVAKLLSCFLIIITAIYYYFIKGWKYNLRDPMKGSNYKVGDLILGFYGGLWAYSGWDVLNYSTGEVANPRRNIPLALLFGIATVTAVYVSINVAYFVALDVETVKSSNAVAALFSQATLGSFANVIPFLIGVLLIGSLNSNLFSGSSQATLGSFANVIPFLIGVLLIGSLNSNLFSGSSQATLGSFANVIPFLIGVLLIGSLNSNLFSGSRYMYAAARQGHLPTCFSCVNVATQSPRVAVLAQSTLAMAISFVGDLDSLINYVMFGFWAQRVFTLIALLLIRHSRIPVHAEAIRVPLWWSVIILNFSFHSLTIQTLKFCQHSKLEMKQCCNVLIFYAALYLIAFLISNQELVSHSYLYQTRLKLYCLRDHLLHDFLKKILYLIFILMRKMCYVVTVVRQDLNYCELVDECTNVIGGLNVRCVRYTSYPTQYLICCHLLCSKIKSKSLDRFKQFMLDSFSLIMI
ncbi:amino acid permease [Dictyocaulus viviparus]|uniref:Amino acid permease n=1 Tax=Dictyocaulus viviparus TaxID=29172 RepID=A0A0D8Y8Y5_DICVI|nr:amino acid permease [Dictyocaulus viviparus]